MFRAVYSMVAIKIQTVKNNRAIHHNNWTEWPPRYLENAIVSTFYIVAELIVLIRMDLNLSSPPISAFANVLEKKLYTTK